MADLSDTQRTAALNIAFDLAKFGIQHFMGRQLAKAEEAELLDVLREREARREFKTPSELLGNVSGGTTGEEE